MWLRTGKCNTPRSPPRCPLPPLLYSGAGRQRRLCAAAGGAARDGRAARQAGACRPCRKGLHPPLSMLLNACLQPACQPLKVLLELSLPHILAAPSSSSATPSSSASSAARLPSGAPAATASRARWPTCRGRCASWACTTSFRRARPATRHAGASHQRPPPACFPSWLPVPTARLTMGPLPCRRLWRMGCCMVRDGGHCAMRCGSVRRLVPTRHARGGS